MTKMPPDGYPAFLQYLQSVRVRKLLMEPRRQARQTLAAGGLRDIRVPFVPDTFSALEQPRTDMDYLLQGVSDSAG